MKEEASPDSKLENIVDIKIEKWHKPNDSMDKKRRAERYFGDSDSLGRNSIVKESVEKGRQKVVKFLKPFTPQKIFNIPNVDQGRSSAGKMPLIEFTRQILRGSYAPGKLMVPEGSNEMGDSGGQRHRDRSNQTHYYEYVLPSEDCGLIQLEQADASSILHTIQPVSSLANDAPLFMY